jgi:hypothetical protein
LFFIFASIVPAMADDSVRIIQNQNTETRELPGNTTVVTNGGGGPTGVLIRNDDESLLYRTLVRPNERIATPVVPSTAYQSDINQACPGALSVNDRNKCVRDVLRIRERYYRKLND